MVEQNDEYNHGSTVGYKENHETNALMAENLGRRMKIFSVTLAISAKRSARGCSFCIGKVYVMYSDDIICKLARQKLEKLKRVAIFTANALDEQPKTRFPFEEGRYVKFLSCVLFSGCAGLCLAFWPASCTAAPVRVRVPPEASA